MKAAIVVSLLLGGAWHSPAVWAAEQAGPVHNGQANFAKDKAICEDIHGQTAETRIAGCTRALAFNVRDAQLWFYRAYAWDDLSDARRAVLDLGTAIKFDPNYTDAYYNRGLAYFALQEYDRALADYTRALELSPSDPDTWLNRGNVYYAQKKLDQALADYSQVLVLEPEYPKAMYNQALIWTDLGDYDKGIRAYTHLILLLPNEIEHYLKRAWLLALQREFAEAEVDLNVALSLVPDAPNSLEMQGWVAYLQGKPAEARQAFEKLWPLIEGPADWAVWIDEHQTHLLTGLTLSESQKQALQARLEKARESNELEDLIAVYEGFLALHEKQST